MLPPDTMAFASFVLEPDLDQLREQLKDQRIGDFGSEFADALSYGPLGVDEDDTLSGLVDALPDDFREAFGLDLERDFLSWMTGEFSLALLPTSFRGVGTDPPTDAIEVAAFVQFDSEKHDDVVGAVNRVAQLLNDELGLTGDKVSYGGGSGMVFDLEELTGSSVYQAGYLVLGEHLVIASTADALRLVASVGEGAALAAKGREYSRLLDELPGLRYPLIYIDLRGIIQAAVAALDGDDRREYEENVEPFVEPLRALLMAGDAGESVSRFSVLLTVE